MGKYLRTLINVFFRYLDYYIAKVRSLYYGFRIQTGRQLMVWGRIKIIRPENVRVGNNLTINHGVYINATDKVDLGTGVALSAGAMIITTSLLESGISSKEHFNAPVTIGDNVQIGAGAIVLPGVSIGNNVIVGSGSIVSKNIKSNSIVAGVPARLIRKIEV
ncbi:MULTISPECIES: DapH/DapD/GlmU-related protein [unclassified Vibrio]|uniref:acyltransferase n=1 Tax=unclassified Vibrio TaxID=2614977 RepID=UPI00354B9FB8